ncbi:mitochondrial carrier domain-containing protein [Zopfochytrium polystomum]|nr:mitochondrial carrier domain-containing protein [Zopfochytrium polystomum]
MTMTLTAATASTASTTTASPTAAAATTTTTTTMSFITAAPPPVSHHPIPPVSATTTTTTTTSSSPSSSLSSSSSSSSSSHSTPFAYPPQSPPVFASAPAVAAPQPLLHSLPPSPSPPSSSLSSPPPPDATPTQALSQSMAPSSPLAQLRPSSAPPLAWIRSLNDSYSALIFSSVAALTTRLVMHPVDTLKTRIQNSPHPVSVAAAFRAASLPSLYRGVGVSLLFSVPALGVYLSAYDACKRALAPGASAGDSSGVLVHAVSGAAAECLSGLFWTPMEVLKSKLQVGVTTPESQNPSTLDLARRIWRTSGLLGFMRGYWITIGVFVPYSVTYFVCYEQLKLVGVKALSPSQPPSPSQLPAEPSLPSSPSQPPPSSLTPRTLFAVYAASSFTAGAAAGAVSNVFDVLKTRVQAAALSTSATTTTSAVAAGSTTTTTTPGNRPPLPLRRVARELLAAEGGLWSALTKGLVARLLWVAPSVTISMTVFEMLKDWRDGGGDEAAAGKRGVDAV